MIMWKTSVAVFLAAVATKGDAGGSSRIVNLRMKSQPSGPANGLSHAVRFHDATKRNLEVNTQHISQEVTRYRGRQLQSDTDNGGGFSFCDILVPMFEADDIDAGEGEVQCTCEGTVDTTVEMTCTTTDVCDDETLWLGQPTCASKVTVGYTLSGLVVDAGDGTGQADIDLNFEISSSACVDMSWPQLPEYCLTLDFSVTDDETSFVNLDQSCTATLGGDACDCAINIEVGVDVDTAANQTCLSVDCSGVYENWPPVKDGECNAVSVDDGGPVESTSFLLAFDDTDAADDTNNDSGAESSGHTQMWFSLFALVIVAML